MNITDTTTPVIVRVLLNGKSVNALIDSGAGASVIDRGTLERVAYNNEIYKSDHLLVDASGNRMNIVGSTNIAVALSSGENTTTHNFKILDSKTFSNVILGRDFLQKFGTVKVDFTCGKVRLGNFTCDEVKSPENERVKLNDNVMIAARSEQAGEMQSNTVTHHIRLRASTN